MGVSASSKTKVGKWARSGAGSVGRRVGAGGKTAGGTRAVSDCEIRFVWQKLSSGEGAPSAGRSTPLGEGSGALISVSGIGIRFVWQRSF